MSEPFSTGGGVTGYNQTFVGGTGTTTKIFPSLLGSGFNTGGANLGTSPNTFQTPDSKTPAAICLISGTGQFEQQQIVFNASGYVFVHGTTPTVNFVLQNGTSLTAASNTTVATLASAQSLTTNATYPWALTVKGQGDAVSGVFQFYSATIVCNGTSGTVTLTNLTSTNLTTKNLSFVVGITFGVSDATNLASLAQFSLTVA